MTKPGKTLKDPARTEGLLLAEAVKLCDEIAGIIGRELPTWHREHILELVNIAHFEVRRNSLQYARYEADRKTIKLLVRSIAKLQSQLATNTVSMKAAVDDELNDLRHSLTNAHKALLFAQGLVTESRGRRSNDVLDCFVANGATVFHSLGLHPTASWNSKTSSPGPSGHFARVMLAFRPHLPIQLRCASEEAFIKSVQKMLGAWRRWPDQPSEDPSAWGKKRPPADSN